MLTSLPSISNAIPEGDTSKRAKRRSLLPQFARKASGEENAELGVMEEEDESKSSRSRPASEETRDAGELLGRKAIDEDRKAMPPPSKLSRPVSMIPPCGSSQPSKSHAKRSHVREEPKTQEPDAETARAQSLAALTGTQAPPSPSKIAIPESGLSRSGSTRLPQSPRVGGPVIPSRTTSTRPRDNHSRAISGIVGGANISTIPERHSSVRRPRAPVQIEQAPQDAPKTSPPPASAISHSRSTSQIPGQQILPQPSMMSRGRPGSQMLPSAPRPAFSTYQQHYSPAKSALPKPPLPPTKPLKPSTGAEEDVTVSFDVTKQQIELLQLSILHQASGQCMRDYTASAKRKLGKKHTKLRKDYESIRATELVHQHIANLSALESWCCDSGLLVENLQILSLVYSDLTSLIEDGSRYGDIVSMFELWLNGAEAPAPATFIQPLPDDWKSAHASLALKLRSIQRNLGVLPPPHASGEDGTGLEVVLKGCKVLVDGMLKELEVMAKLEKELLARERCRIDDEVQALVLDDVGVQQTWIPAWQKAA